MQIATLLIKTSDVHIIPVKNVTPAEAQVLVKIHFKSANGEVIQGGEITGDVKSPGEFNRLTAKYSRYAKEITEMWPGLNAKLPQTFAEAGIQVDPPAPAPEIEIPVPAALPPEPTDEIVEVTEPVVKPVKPAAKKKSTIP